MITNTPATGRITDAQTLDTIASPCGLANRSGANGVSQSQLTATGRCNRMYYNDGRYVAANSRLTIAVHALTWLALAHRRGYERLTSEEVAASVNANAVILRVSLGRLREAGLVEVTRGTGAGWRLARSADGISLADVYDAVQPGPLFSLHHTEPNQQCPVGRGIQPILHDVYASAESAVRKALGAKSVADVLQETLRRSRE